MKDKLIEVLEVFELPIYQQGSLGRDQAYPDSFFTFWNRSSQGVELYDNDEHSYLWDFDLNYYTNDPATLNTKLLEAKQKLKEHGFIVFGKGYDVMSDEKSHVGRGINVKILEK